MATVKSDMLYEGGMYTFSALPNDKFAKIPGTNTYVNGKGQQIVYNASTKEYQRVGYENKVYDNNASNQDMDDGSASHGIVANMSATTSNGTRTFSIYDDSKSELKYNSDAVKSLMHQNNLLTSDELDLYNKTYRFGYFNPVTITNTREFLFFTKPDLHILDNGTSLGTDANGNTRETKYPGIPSSSSSLSLSSSLANIPFWKMLTYNNAKTIHLLQSSLAGKKGDKFNHLLQNQCISNLEVPALSSEMIDTATNTYGVGFSYRGSSEASDDKPSFSLEFKETKYLDIYYYFKAYEEYETLKHHGIVTPFKEYIEQRIVHDQMAIYKFIVDEDMETILYYGKMYGVVPKSLPRDVFGTTTFDNGLSYSVDFEAAFYEDMNPHIIKDFNALSKPYYDKKKYRIDTYNDVLDSIDNRATAAAYIEIEEVTDSLRAQSKYATKSNTGYIFKLRWRGDDKV